MEALAEFQDNKKKSAFIDADTIRSFFFSPNRSAILCFEFLLVSALFFFFAKNSPYMLTGKHNMLHLGHAIAYSSIFVLVSFGMGLYERNVRFIKTSTILLGAAATLFAVMITIALVYIIYYDKVGRLTVIYGATGALIGFLTNRFCLSWFLKRYPYKFTILGESLSTKEIENFCKKGGTLARYYSLVPFVATDLEPSKRLLRGLKNQNVSTIVCAESCYANKDMMPFINDALNDGFRIVDSVDFYIETFERLPIDDVTKRWVIREGFLLEKPLTDVTKRLFDFVAALAALVLLSPVLLAIAMAIKISSKGPIFYIQLRSGRFEKPFNMYKFRTFKLDFCSTDKPNSFTIKKDPRVTWIGKALRPLHFDELPQLWNIIKGEMSIVGARPEALGFAHEMSQQIELYELRYLMRPGLTGHAQINQGYAMNNVLATKRKLSYDLFYLTRYSLLLDFSIIVKTVFNLAKGAR